MSTSSKNIIKNEEKIYTYRGVGCLVLTHDNQLLLQLRDDNAPTYPNYLSIFGGAIEANETPMQALVRELHEELGADVDPEDVVGFGAFKPKEGQISYLYFWHDKLNTITGCYEGKAKRYNNLADITKHPKIMNDVNWLIAKCKKLELIKID